MMKTREMLKSLPQKKDFVRIGSNFLLLIVSEKTSPSSINALSFFRLGFNHLDKHHSCYFNIQSNLLDLRNVLDPYVCVCLLVLVTLVIWIFFYEVIFNQCCVDGKLNLLKHIFSKILNHQ